MQRVMDISEGFCQHKRNVSFDEGLKLLILQIAEQKKQQLREPVMSLFFGSNIGEVWGVGTGEEAMYKEACLEQPLHAKKVP